MDGYTLTAKLKKMRRRFKLTATEQAIYHELVGICNEDGWEDIFCASNEEICSALSISENTLNTSRQTLINVGLIYYLSGKSKRQVGKYSFKKPFKEKKITTSKNESDVEIIPEVDAYTNPEVDAEDYIKTKTKTKTKKELKEKVSNFSPPDIDLVKAYCNERNNCVNPDRFFDFYQSKGWMIGKNKMKDWKAAVRTWEKEDKKNSDNGKTSEIYIIPD